MINIQQYNFQPIQKYPQPAQNPYMRLQPLKRDTVNFTSKNLLSMSPDKITKAVQGAVRKNQEIGYGSEGVVYKIPNSDYCVKVYNGEGVNNLGNWNLNVSSQDKINHVVARAENNSVIMKLIKGLPLKSDKPDEIFDLPKQSYRNFLIQLSKAYDECMQFDNFSSNIIYNKEKKSLTAIDFFEPNPDIDFEFQPLQDVFKCLKSRGNTPKDKELNKKLGINLLSVVKNELENKEPEFYIDKWDVDGLLYDIYVSQDYEIPNKVKQLRREINKSLKE